ncbi:hypothetical protein ACFXHD_25380 [Streptomyces hydrogenans]|uniref:hypothetical protein n=1 Tax=Streptomyces hydrogenans TaxID=1873719 RepID=UPI00367F176C
MSDRPHGYARYKLDGCHCYTCAWAVSEYTHQRETAVKAGTWQPYVPAAPVREHIRRLQECGMGLRAIATAADVDRKRLQGIITGRPDRSTGPQEKVRPHIAIAVLRVEPTLDTLAPRALVTSTGTHRRLQALMAAGWPKSHLADRMGWTYTNLSALLKNERVMVQTARAARDLYDQLWNVAPVSQGVAAHIAARTQARAADRRWAPVGAWDDDTIDDPSTLPDWTGACGTADGFNGHRRMGHRPCRPCRAAYRRAHQTNPPIKDAA